MPSIGPVELVIILLIILVIVVLVSRLRARR
jgi:hypothetical protein